MFQDKSLTGKETVRLRTRYHSIEHKLLHAALHCKSPTEVPLVTKVGLAVLSRIRAPANNERYINAIKT